MNCSLSELSSQSPAIYVEQRIYDGFPSHDDEAMLAAFHRQEWPRRIDLIPSIEDERYRELGERVIAIEQPQLLTATQRTRWQEWREERLLATSDVPWLTLTDAIAELEGFSDAALGDQRQQLSDIRQFLRSVERKCAVVDALPRPAVGFDENAIHAAKSVRASRTSIARIN